MTRLFLSNELDRALTSNPKLEYLFTNVMYKTMFDLIFYSINI